MKIEGQVTKNIEKQDVNLPQTEEEAALLSVSNVPFSELINQGTGTISSDDIDYLSSLPVDYNFDSMSMNIEDGLLFISLALKLLSLLQNTKGFSSTNSSIFVSSDKNRTESMFSTLLNTYCSNSYGLSRIIGLFSLGCRTLSYFESA